MASAILSVHVAAIHCYLHRRLLYFTLFCCLLLPLLCPGLRMWSVRFWTRKKGRTAADDEDKQENILNPRLDGCIAQVTASDRLYLTVSSS